MKIEDIAVDTLILDPSNVRKHGAANLEAIKRSLTAFGQQKPIVIDSDNVVIAGNGFLTAARELGWHSVKCVRTLLKGDKAAAFAIADNRTAELAHWDMTALQSVLDSMSVPDQLTTGWDSDELAALLGRAASGDVYKPILAPEFSKNAVTHDDVDRAGSVFNVDHGESVKMPMTCPHCGEDFEIDRPR
jgi:hypothetical protein